MNNDRKSMDALRHTKIGREPPNRLNRYSAEKIFILFFLKFNLKDF